MAARGDDLRGGQRTPVDGYLQYSIHKKEAAEPQRPRHTYTVAGQVPGGLFTVDDDRLMFSASRMAQTRSATHCNLALIGMGS